MKQRYALLIFLFFSCASLAQVPYITLEQNIPNPFTGTTEINFSLSKPAHVIITVYDILGKEIIELVNMPLQQGLHSIAWSGKNEAGRPVAGGTYIYQLRAGDILITKRAILK